MRKKRIKWTVRWILFNMTIVSLLILGFAACGTGESEPVAAMATFTPSPSPVSTPRPTPSPTPVPTEPPFLEYDITLMAVGDNLMHMGIVSTGIQADGSYDFSFLFENISDFLEASDISVINQETILGGNELGFSGFPYFNSPTEVGDAIAAAGFNVVLHASNHAADQGMNGLNNCVSFWEQYPEVLMVGISGNDQDTEPDIPLLSIGDITFAVLNYTYSPNTEILNRSLMGHLNMLCDYNPETGAISLTTLNPQVLQDIQEAKQKADIVIVCPHWGTEYTTRPSSYQQTFAKEMADAGADLILGTHPHAPQPVEWITAEDGHRTLCYYSLGNYVSTQKQAVSMLEEMAWVTFRVTEDQVFIDENASGVVPLICHYKSSPVRLTGVYPLEDYTEEMAASHGIWNYGGVPFSLEDMQNKSQEIFGDMILSKSEILAQSYTPQQTDGASGL